MQNLREKSALNCLSKLDKQVLSKMQQVMMERPQHYSSKIGYLQMLYRK